MKPTDLPKNFCILPFISSRVTFGAAVPCCVNHSEVFGYTKETSVQDIYSSTNSRLMEFRRAFLNNHIPASCKSCIMSESHGEISHRILSNERWGHLLEEIEINSDGAVNSKVEQPIFFIDGAGGTNRCDLKCRMCHSLVSSANRAEELKHGIPMKVMNVKSEILDRIGGRTVEVTSFNDSDEWFEFVMSNIKTLRNIHYDSGEALINPDTYKTLELLRANGRTDLPLTFHSNLLKAGIKGKKFADEIKGFSNITVNCSMDALKEKNYYIRYPSVHDEIWANLIELKEKNPSITLKLAVTFQLLNSLSAGELIEYALRSGLFTHITLEYLRFPYAYSAGALTTTLKKKAISYWEEHKERVINEGLPQFHFRELSHCLQMMLNTDFTEHLPLFFKETFERDQIRKQNLFDTFPEFIELYNQSS